MTTQKKSGPTEEMLEQLRRDPEVNHYRRKDSDGSWTFKPLIRVKPGTDLLELLERIPRRSDQ